MWYDKFYLVQSFCALLVSLWMLPILLTVLVAPFILASIVISVFVAGSVASNSVVLFFFPVVGIIASNNWKTYIQQEFELLALVGPKRLLWSEKDHHEDGSSSDSLIEVPLEGHDVVLQSILCTVGSSFPAFAWLLEYDHVSVEDLSSILWSWFVTAAHGFMMGPNIVGFLFSMALFRACSKVHLFSRNLAYKVVKWHFAAVVFCFCADASSLVQLLQFVNSILELVGHGDFRLWLKWRITHLAVSLTVLSLDAINVSRKYTPLAFSQLSGASSQRSFIGLAREKMMQATIFLSDLGLPHYIRGTRSISKEALQESLKDLKELGWPVNVNLNDEVALETEILGFKEWLLCGTDWHQGVRNLKAHTDHLLDALRVGAVEFRRTEEYGSTLNELEATSRYFRSPRYDYPDLELDDVWFLVKETFAHSRLTPFNYIIRMWEKKYGLGAFFRRPGSRGKLSRKAFIKSIGGLRPFKELWRRTFAYATQIHAVSAVSIKGEALPPKKWLEGKVRSIIGTPLVHYIMSTIWNYEPNHRFAWVDTPTKIGMPLNGYWLADLYHRHSRCQHHYAGDMSAFDSTISGKVQDLIKAVRKKGYEEHRDHKRICTLIDVAYDQLEHQLLNTTSTGQIYKKGTGLTTGHSSTSADNSLGLCILYLFAWKELTGLSAKEFVFFNELSDYGDDHVLSYTSTKPAAWNFSNIQKTMAKWGVTNRLEASGDLSKIPFLSKFSRRVNNEDRAIFKKLQIPVPKRIVYHDRDRLVGKMVAKVLNPDPRYRCKRLLSYLSLTAHHEDVYLGIKKVLTRSSTMKRAMKEMKVTIPTYQKVLADWYHPSEHSVTDIFDEVSGESEKSGRVFSYGQVGWLDTMIGSLSLVPDVVNPALFNFGYDRLLQLQSRSWNQWAFDFVVLSNGLSSVGEIRRCLSNSAYGCLIPDLYTGGIASEDSGIFLYRHWAYMTYWWFFRSRNTAPWLAGFTKKVADLQFLLNGKVAQDFASFNWKIADLVVIWFCNLLPLSPYLGFVARIVLPRLDVLWNMVSGWFLGFFWTSIPPNYKDVTHHLRQLPKASGPLLVQAPTGTGKSTAFIKHVSLTVGSMYKKIIVVEPRSVLVRTLVPYVRDVLGLDCTGRTTGFDFDGTRHVWYVTAQEALLHLSQTLQPDHLIIIDECHVAEPAYIVLQKALSKRSDIHCVWTTATPSALNLEMCSAVIPLVIANVWGVIDGKYSSGATDTKTYLKDYRARVVDIINNMPRTSKALVFYPSKKGGHDLAEHFNTSTSFLNSEEDCVDSQVIVTTSVADAGLTLPNVDLVITPVIDYTGQGITGAPALGSLSAAQLTQRKGRTGRTNNGSFIIFEGPNLQVPTCSELQQDPVTIVGSLVSSGLSLKVLRGLDIALYKDFISKLPDRGQGKISPESLTGDTPFEKSLFACLDNIAPWASARHFQESDAIADGAIAQTFDYTAAGVVSVSTLQSVSSAVESIFDVVAGLQKYQPGQSDILSQGFRSSLMNVLSITGTNAPWFGFLPFELVQDIEENSEEKTTKQEWEFYRTSWSKLMA